LEFADHLHLYYGRRHFHHVDYWPVDVPRVYEIGTGSGTFGAIRSRIQLQLV
jgi:hypothetical protein